MYSDGLTLRAVPYFLNIELNILPSVVRDGRLLVAVINSIARAGFTLDHFAEDQVLYNLVRERNQDYFQYNLTDEDETVNNSINNKLRNKVLFIRDDKRNKQEKKEKYQSIINEDDANTIGFSFKTFGKSDSVTERGFTSRGFCK